MSSRNAFIRYLPLVLLCVLVCVGAAVALGMSRKPQYTAEASLNVGKLDAQTQALPGFIQGATSLASSYSRVATSDRLQRQVASRTGIPLSKIRGHLSAAPIPGAPLMRIRGSAESRATALRLTRGATVSLVDYIRNLATGNEAARRLLKRYRSVSAQAVSLQQRVTSADAQRRRDGTTTVSPELTKLKVDARAAELRANTLASLFTQAREQGTGGASVEVLSAAASATSDRGHFLQRLIAAGLVGGLCLGAALAGLRSRRLTSRVT